MRRGFAILFPCGFLLAAFLASVAHAIIIRHDRDDAEYCKRGERFPAVVRILPAETGTLVDRRLVLTAAHVAEGMARQALPRVDVNGAEYRVTRIYLHPGWRGHGAHDIALLRLDQGVRNIEPARLFRHEDEKGMQILFVGFGDAGTGLTGPEWKDDVRRAATNRVDDADDDWLYFAFNAPGEGATDWEGVSGPGDSGGPALFEENDHVLVLGVSSHGFDGKPGRYGTREAYTRVSTHLEWIDAVLDGRLEESGFAPGRMPPAGNGARSITGGRANGPDLATVAGGTLIIDYVEAYNSRDDATMSAFIEAHFSPAYRARQPLEDMLAWYGRMLSQHFGTLQLQAVVQASAEQIVVRISGDTQRQGELHVRFSADGRIDDLMAAIIDGGP